MSLQCIYTSLTFFVNTFLIVGRAKSPIIHSAAVPAASSGTVSEPVSAPTGGGTPPKLAGETPALHAEKAATGCIPVAMPHKLRIKDA